MEGTLPIIAARRLAQPDVCGPTSQQLIAKSHCRIFRLQGTVLVDLHCAGNIDT